MEMTIEEQIKALEYLKKCGIFPFSDTKTGIVFDDEYIDAAIETMHKYQKIEQIIEDWESDKGWALEMSELYWLDRIKEEVEDGNDS